MNTTNVLLVDDEKEFVDTLAQRIRLRRMDPWVAYTGEEALKMVAENIPDVMVLDLKLPGMDGTDVLLRIKESHPGINVIILTGHGNEKDRITLEEMGASGYLQKPVDIEILLETIHRVQH